MSRIGMQVLALASALVASLSVARAYEYDSATVGYADYGGASYARDYCYEPDLVTRTKVHGVFVRTFNGSEVLAYYAGMCQRNSLGQWRYTIPRGTTVNSTIRPALECPNRTDAVDGLRGYSNVGGVTGISASCNNGSYSTPLAAMQGATGPYYNSVRCPSGSVAWGLWGSLGNSRIGRLGMICNNWWP